MKILWIEDGGGTFAGKSLARDIFASVLPPDHYDDVHDAEVDRSHAEVFPELFARHTLHELHVAISFLEWRDTWAREKEDYDVLLIDLNLERHPTPKKDLPKSAKAGFDREAGLYIYNHVITHGFPREQIAFFTGQGMTLKKFRERCGEIRMEPPRIAFEKKKAHIPKIAAWLGERAADPRVILRRSAIDGAARAADCLRGSTPSQLEQRLPLFKTSYFSIAETAETRREQVIGWLEEIPRLMSFTRLHEPGSLGHLVQALSRHWAISEGRFTGTHPETRSLLEERELLAAQQFMLVIRSFVNHGLYPEQPGVENAALTVVLALRGLVHFEALEPMDHERLLEPLLDELVKTGDLRKSLEHHLSETYDELVSDLEINLMPTEGTLSESFAARVEERLESLSALEPLQRERRIEEFRRLAPRIALLAFLHTMFPAEIAKIGSYEATLPLFTVQTLDKGSFLEWFALRVVEQTPSSTQSADESEA